jgi:hypothetical protein
METDLERAQSLSALLLAARTAHRRAEHTLACLLAELVHDKLFRPLGYVSVEEYAARILDLTTRQTRDLLRIGRALPGLPRLAAVMEAGELDWTKARELVRVATPETEEAWIARAKAVPSRVLEQQVGGLLRGAPPPDEGAVRADAVSTFVARMESADLDALRATLAALRVRLSATAEELDDGALLGVLARRVLATLEREAEEEAEGASEGHAAEAEEAAEGESEGHAGAEAAEAGAEAEAEAAAGPIVSSGPAARAFTGERYRVVVALCPECQDRHLPNPGAVDAGISDTIEAEAACDAEVVDLREGPKQGHVTRTIPPAVRRRVLGRAKWRCEVPYCRNRLWLDVHHIHQRSDGGDHDPRGLVCLCDGHHRAVHAGNLGVERTPNGAVAVFRADGTVHVGARP